MIRELLEKDHARLDALPRRATEADAFDVEAYEAFRAELLRHIALEEKILLPEARRLRRGEPFPVEKRLHADHAALAALVVPTPTREIVGTIREVLDEHNPLEEGPAGVYAACEKVLGAELEAVMARLRAAPEVRVAAHFDGPHVGAMVERLLRERKSASSTG